MGQDKIFKTGDVVRVTATKDQLDEEDCTANPGETYEVINFSPIGGALKLDSSAGWGRYIPPEYVVVVEEDNDPNQGCPDCGGTGQIKLIRSVVPCECQKG